MALDWRTAYFQQAKSDYEMLLKLLSEEDIPPCQSLHYLQMTTEKLAKGLLTRPGGSHYPKVVAQLRLIALKGEHPRSEGEHEVRSYGNRL